MENLKANISTKIENETSISQIIFKWSTLLYVGCPSKKYTRPIVPKLSICWEPKTYQMKDTFIRNKKVFHIESWISDSLASSEPEREVTLKTPVQFLKNLKKIFLLTLSNFQNEIHYRLLPFRKQNIDILCCL